MILDVRRRVDCAAKAGWSAQALTLGEGASTALWHWKDFIGQATKGSRWIPWHTEAMKDVVTCDKSRGAGNTL